MSIADLGKPAGSLIRMGPVVDGWILPEVPQRAFNDGKQNDAATLMGLVMDEGRTSR
jgi:carboxylesterase type B